MTIPGLGKLTPIQIDMVSLSGCLTREFYPDADKRTFSETERLWLMKRARFALTKLTGEDYGYDLSQWHAYLTTANDDHGYTHSYGCSQTEKIITRRISDPETKRLAQKADELKDELGWYCRDAPSVDKLHPQIRTMLANLRNEIHPSDTRNCFDEESAFHILVLITGINCGFDPDKWESILVT
ncbi:MAG: hypothetical protein QM501_03480 [Gimesia sp.]